MINKTSPIITVLMPVYNGEIYLKKAIDSILTQTFQDFELIIINDGSRDGSQKIIKSYNDQRIRLINQDNQGLVGALNNGIKLSLGKYIVRMDQDDISMKNRLFEQINFMESNPNIGISGTYIILIDKFDNSIGRMVYPLAHEEIKAQLLFSSPLAHPSVIIRKSILQKNDLKYLNVKSEDYDLWVRSAQVTQLANVGKFLLKYRVGVGISKNSHKDDYDTGAQQIIKKFLLDLGDFSESEIICQQKMYTFGYVPDRKFLNESFFLLEKIKSLNKMKQIYRTADLNLTIIVKWFSVCGRMCKKQLFVLPEFWFNSILLFFRLSFKNKISLLKKMISKFGSNSPI